MVFAEESNRKGSSSVKETNLTVNLEFEAKNGGKLPFMFNLLLRTCLAVFVICEHMFTFSSKMPLKTVRIAVSMNRISSIS